MNQSSGGKIQDKAEVIGRTVMSQQPFYKSIDCNENHRQLLETMVGAAIWYLPQGKELWTGEISVEAIRKLSETNRCYRIWRICNSRNKAI